MQEFIQELQTEWRLLMDLHKRSAWIILCLPVVYTLLFGGLFYKNRVVQVPVMVCNLDEGSCGRSLIEDLRSTPELKIMGICDEPTDVIADGDVGVVIIPADFSKKISQGEPVQIASIVDFTNTVQGGEVSKALQDVVGSYSAEIAVKERIVAGWPAERAMSAVPIQLSSRSLYNPTGGYNDFFLVVLIIHALQIAVVFVLGPSMVLEKKRRGSKLRRCRWQCLTAKLLTYSLLELGIIGLCLGGALWFFDIICRADFWGVLLLLSTFCLAITSFALCVGSWLKRPTKAITYALFYIMPSILFTGAIWPRSSMDTFSLTLSYLLPIGYAADDLRCLLVQGTASDLFFHLAMLGSMGVVFFLLAGIGLRHTIGESADERYIGTRNKIVAL